MEPLSADPVHSSHPVGCATDRKRSEESPERSPDCISQALAGLPISSAIAVSQMKEKRYVSVSPFACFLATVDSIQHPSYLARPSRVVQRSRRPRKAPLGELRRFEPAGAVLAFIPGKGSISALLATERALELFAPVSHLPGRHANPATRCLSDRILRVAENAKRRR